MNPENTQDLPQTAIITGAAKRIGAEIAKTLHAAGFKVILHCYKSLLDTQILAEKFNNNRSNSSIVIQQDLTQAGNGSIINAAINWAGNLTLLVNNASMFARTRINNLSTDLHLELYAINVLAPWQLSILARPWLQQTHGCIINITDIHSEKPLKNYAEYCQSKAALTMQTKALAREFAPDIRVNAVAPGAIMWPTTASNLVSSAVKTKIIQQTPLGRHGSPAAVAQAVLALSANNFITGQTLNIDGGRSIV